ncbi:MAG: substrate-binding domain-containing protein [Spirochaetota bacterium]|nr:MAG: substrate-binding domain-containing protein [Spirochaetota bacterium]
MKKTVTIIVAAVFLLTTMVFAPMAMAKPFPRSWLWNSTALQMMDTSKFAKKGPYVVGFSNASISNSWRVFFERQVRYGYELNKDQIKRYYVTDANDKPDKQIADVEDLLAKGVDVLILSAATMAALDPVARRTMRRGIPVICVDRRVTSDESFVSFITSSNVAQGRAQMLWLAEMLGGRGNIVMLGGIAGSGPAEERRSGGEEILSAFPNVKVLDFQYANWSPAEGKRIMKALIQTHGRKINGIWGDGLQTSGAMEAMKEAGMKVPITGDHLNAFLVRAQDWGFPAMSIDFPVSMGTDSVEIALKVLRGEPVPHIYEVPRTVVCTQDTENIKTDMPWSRMAHKDWPDEAWNNTLPKNLLPY